MDLLQQLTRRHFFKNCAVGVGSIALASLLSESVLASPQSEIQNPQSKIPPRGPHHQARAKNVIYLFMAGGPSQLELFDYKPKLVELNGQAIPDSIIEGKRFAFMDSSFKDRSKLLGTRRKFSQHGKHGAWVSELFPYQAKTVDDLASVN